SRVDLRRPPRRRPWRQVALLAAAALVLPVTVVAGAVRLAGIRHFAPATLFVAGRTPAARTEPKTAAPPAPRGVEAPGEHVDEVPALNEMPAVVDVPRAPETPRAHLPVPAAPRAAAVPAIQQSPQDMLQNANDLRAQHQWLGATQVYEKILRTFPGRPEA